MYKKLLLVIVLVCLGLSNLLYAQDSDSLKTTGTSGFDVDFSELDSFKLIDTVLNEFYQYEKDGRHFYSGLGNPGLNYSTMLFKTLEYGFHTGETGFLNNFDIQPNNLVYNTNIPFARVSYKDGPKKYQNFDVLFSESINSRLNFTVGYNTQSSTGFYLNQETITKRFDFQTSFRNRENTYGVFFRFKVRNGSAQENGGIKSDSLYNELTLLSPFDINNNKLRVQVWKEEAVNNYDYRNVYVNQYFSIIKGANKKDFGLTVGLENDGGYNDIWYEGFIVDSNYYKQLFDFDVVDSSSVYDQSKLFYVKNKGYFKLDNLFFQNAIIAGIGYDYFENKNIQRFDAFSSTEIYATLPHWEIGETVLNGSFTKGISGYNSEGLELAGDINIPIMDSVFEVKVSGHHLRSLTDYKKLVYGGNTISWNNDFSYCTSMGGDLDLVFDKLKLLIHGEYEMNGNYVYFASNGLPNQMDNSFSRYLLKLEKRFALGNYHFDVSVINQGVDEGVPVNLAEWVGVVSFYYQRMLFKNAMELRYGIDYWQFSRYYADAYAPFTRSFVYQNSYEVGDFPYLNFYISARIKGAQGFVNFQNIGQFVFRENYMMTPTYAMQDFGVSFGLRWDFYN